MTSSINYFMEIIKKMLLYIMLGVISVLFLVSLIIIRNLYVSLLKYQKFTQNILNSVTKALQKMRQIDKSGAFQANDSVGYVFSQLLLVVKQLEQDITSQEK